MLRWLLAVPILLACGERVSAAGGSLVAHVPPLRSPFDPFVLGAERTGRAVLESFAMKGAIIPGAAGTAAGAAIFLGGIALVGVGIFLGAKLIVQRLRLRQALRAAEKLVFLSVMIPRKSHEESDREAQKDLKGLLSLAAQFFSSMSALGKPKGRLDPRAYSFEITAHGGEVHFGIVVPEAVANFVEKQVTAFYPSAFLERTTGLNFFTEGGKVVAATMNFTKDSYYPLRDIESQSADPLDSVVNAMSKFSEGEGGAVQVLIRPASDKWADAGRSHIKSELHGKKSGMLAQIVDAILGRESKSAEPKRLTPREEENLRAVGEKCAQMGFETRIRLVVSAGNETNAELYLRNMTSAFAALREPERNGFEAVTVTGRKARDLVRAYVFRLWDGPERKVMTLSQSELGMIFHFPNPKWNLSDAIKWQLFKLAPAPARLPASGVYLGDNLHRGERRRIFIPEKDRFRHLYVIGQTGQGKSQTLTNLALQDLMNGNGFCVMDPHGDLAEDILKFVPRERSEDVVYFSPSDTTRPMGLNLLETDGTPEEKDFVTLEALNIMIKLFGEEVFSPRLQDYFRNGVLALLDSPEGGAITDLVPLFTNEDFQRKVRSTIQNPIVRSWWDDTYDKQGKNEKEEMIPFWAAKFGGFITNGTVRNVIGQVKSSFSVPDIMDSGKILLVNLSKGNLGEINAQLLGMILVTKIQMAAMRRARMPEDQRRPFFFYIDEFQNFVTDSIESILSEARKYRLSLNVAHQYIDQLVDKQGKDKVKKAIFGNVGSMISLKVSAGDAEYLAKEFEPVFSSQDLISFDAFHAAAKISVDNKPTVPFSLAVMKPWERPWERDEKLGTAIRELSRLKYGRKREFVDKEILGRLGVLEPRAKPAAGAGGEPPKFDFAKLLADMRAKREAASAGNDAAALSEANAVEGPPSVDGAPPVPGATEGLPATPPETDIAPSQASTPSPLAEEGAWEAPEVPSTPEPAPLPPFTVEPEKSAPIPPVEPLDATAPSEAPEDPFAEKQAS